MGDDMAVGADDMAVGAVSCRKRGSYWGLLWMMVNVGLFSVIGLCGPVWVLLELSLFASDPPHTVPFSTPPYWISPDPLSLPCSTTHPTSPFPRPSPFTHQPLPPLPPQYLPSAWACLALFASLSLHALFHLMGHWIIGFKVRLSTTSQINHQSNQSTAVVHSRILRSLSSRPLTLLNHLLDSVPIPLPSPFTLHPSPFTLYSSLFTLRTPHISHPPTAPLPHPTTYPQAATLFAPAPAVDLGCSVLVTPPANRGTPLMVPLTQSKTTSVLQIEFQRQKYFYTPAHKLGAAGKEFPHGVFTLSACPVDRPLSHYTHCGGVATDAEVEKLIDRWGKNHVAVQPPSFMYLLQQQMMSPLAIFQVFCAMLWLLDEYWSYTAWSLLSIVIFQVGMGERGREGEGPGGSGGRSWGGNEAGRETYLVKHCYFALPIRF